jgi:hypothetical protein
VAHARSGLLLLGAARRRAHHHHRGPEALQPAAGRRHGGRVRRPAARQPRQLPRLLRPPGRAEPHRRA